MMGELSTHASTMIDELTGLVDRRLTWLGKYQAEIAKKFKLDDTLVRLEPVVFVPM